MTNYRGAFHLRDLIVKLLHHAKKGDIQVLVAQKDIREGIAVVLENDGEVISEELRASINKLERYHETETVSIIEELFKEFDAHTKHYLKAEDVRPSRTWVSGYGTGGLKSNRPRRHHT